MRDAPFNAQLHMLMLKTCVWGDPPPLHSFCFSHPHSFTSAGSDRGVKGHRADEGHLGLKVGP